MRKKFILLGVLAASFAAVGVANVTSANVSAQDETFTIAPTAGVKLMETAKDSGIRFSFSMVGETFETLVEEGAEIGAIIAPADVAATTALTWTNATAEGSVLAYQQIPADKWLKGNDGNYSTYAYLYGLPEEYYNRAISAVGVVQEGTTEETCTYTATTTKSMAEVAVAALADETQDWTNEEKALIGAYVLDYEVTIKDGDKVIDTVPVKYGTKLTDAAGYTVPTKVGYVFDGLTSDEVITGKTEVGTKWVDVSAQWNFDSETALKIVNDNLGSSAIVEDAAAADGYAYSVFLAGSDTNGHGEVSINLGSEYKVSEISAINIRFRIPECGAKAIWWRVMVNGTTRGSGNSGIDATVKGANTAGNAVISSYATIQLTQSAILTYLAATNTGGEDTVLNTVNFWTQWRPGNFKDNGFWTHFYIDSIEVVEYVPLKFNVLKEGTTDEYVLMDVTNESLSGYLTTKEASFDITAEGLQHKTTSSWGNSALTYTLPSPVPVSEIAAVKVVLKATTGLALLYPYGSNGTSASYIALHGNHDTLSDYASMSKNADGSYTYMIAGAAFGGITNLEKIVFSNNNTAGNITFYSITYFKTYNETKVEDTNEYVLADYSNAEHAKVAVLTSRNYREQYSVTATETGLKQATGQYDTRWFRLSMVKTLAATTTTKIKFVYTGNKATAYQLIGVNDSGKFVYASIPTTHEKLTISTTVDGVNTVEIDVSDLTAFSWITDDGNATASSAPISFSAIDFQMGAAWTNVFRSVSYFKAA